MCSIKFALLARNGGSNTTFKPPSSIGTVVALVVIAHARLARYTNQSSVVWVDGINDKTDFDAVSLATLYSIFMSTQVRRALSVLQVSTSEQQQYEDSAENFLTCSCLGYSL